MLICRDFERDLDLDLFFCDRDRLRDADCGERFLDPDRAAGAGFSSDLWEPCRGERCFEAERPLFSEASREAFSGDWLLERERFSSVTCFSDAERFRVGEESFSPFFSEGDRFRGEPPLR